MASLNIRRISCTDPNASKELAKLRGRLGAQDELVTRRSRELTRTVFGEPLPPIKVVERVCDDVRNRGAEALLYYTEQFDRVRLDRDEVRVNAAELRKAH